ncbi:MAG: hypothetical protein U0X20_31405 [Caldilineaceae bacterium]
MLRRSRSAVFLRNLLPIVLSLAMVAGALVPGVSSQAAAASLPVTIQQAATTDATDTGSTCINVHTLAIGNPLARSVLQRAEGPEWLQFSVQANARYRLQVNSHTPLQLALYAACDSGGPAVQVAGGQLAFTALRDGDLYLLVQPSAAAAAGADGYTAALEAAAPARPSAAALDEVPADILRRATEFLEELRGSDLAPEWLNARINPKARIFYRPDIQAAAYYEFSVEKPGDQGYVPAGYIELSSGEHDYPITSWSASGASPTEELAEVAPLGVTLTEFYRLDMQTYAAEYQEPSAIGIATLPDEVVTLGTLPVRTEGLDAVPKEPFPLVTETADTMGGETYEGPTELPLLEEKAWDSWDALKAEYAAASEPLHESLQDRAHYYWETEKKQDQYGESLRKGDVRSVYGLAGQTLTAVNVTGAGAGAQYLQQEQLLDNGALHGVRLTVLDEPADMKTLLPIEVALQYTGAVSETVKYAIVNADALQSGNIYLPAVTKGAANRAQVDAADLVPAAVLNWGPWAYWWANGYPGSITYDQIPAHQRVNTSGCWSGCGATAWAMLFGWVDQRAAAGDWRWANHWGIYRVNGGLGANAVAPYSQDAGVDNMTWEIRNRMGTWCTGDGGGATSLSRMIDAIEYVRPRATAAATMRTRYDPTKLCWFGACNDARNLVKDQIIVRQSPAVVGYDNHYAMAYGYAERSNRSCFLFFCSTSWSRWFWVNQGWGGGGNDWINWDDVHLGGTYNNP